MLPGEFIDSTPEPMELQLGDRGSLPPPGYGFIENSDGNRTYFSPQPQEAAPAKARQRTSYRAARPAARDWLDPRQDAPAQPIQWNPGRSTALPRGFAVPQGPGSFRHPERSEEERWWRTLTAYQAADARDAHRARRHIHAGIRRSTRTPNWKSYGKRRGYI